MAGMFPSETWQGPTAREAAALRRPLEAVRQWLDRQAAGQPYRVVVVRGGRILTEWQQGMDAESRLGLASAAKSVFSCMLGIAVAEGKVSSADARVVDYYPEMMDVPEGRGPKPGRFAKPQDREITFRQLISNTSGYMKPGEAPGSTFHYQTFGMNVLCHAIAKAYGLYDSAEPERLPGLGQLVQEKLRDPIGGTWTHRYVNFEHPPGSLTGIFGYYSHLEAGARDLARLGLLWLHWGRWGRRQLVPEQWLREAVRTAPDIVANCPKEQWCYGYGFWTNEHGLLWPSLPRDSFAANGAGRIHVWVCPSLDLVVTQSPGIYQDQKDNDSGLLGRLAAALA